MAHVTQPMNVNWLEIFAVWHFHKDLIDPKYDNMPLKFELQITEYWIVQMRYYESMNLKALQSCGSLKFQVH